MNRTLIRTKNVYKSYRIGDGEVPVLEGVSLEIAAGEFVALMGASGSGKSTLMNILGCLDRPSAGRYYLDEEEVSTLPAERLAAFRNRKIGFVFQNFNLLRRTSALENVMMPLSYCSAAVSDAEARERALALLQRVGLEDRAGHEPSQLSGGQQQRVAIARSLINHPSLLLADEPTGNLDSHTSLDILHMFQTLNREEGITVLLVTHDPGVAHFAKRIISIRDGVISEGERAHGAEQV